MAREYRWLVIVQRDRPDLMSPLRAQYPDATIVLDRRQTERRRRTVPVPIERRARQRRKPLALQDLVMWESQGYRLVYLPGRPAARPPASEESRGVRGSL
jgi:hypothetical protein